MGTTVAQRTPSDLKTVQAGIFQNYFQGLDGGQGLLVDVVHATSTADFGDRLDSARE